MQFYKNIGSELMFRKMIVLDALTFNVDRHAGNHGVLVDNDAQTAVRMAPIFDFNLSMLPYIEKEDWVHIGDKLSEYGPRIGEDFTRIGQQAMTSEIRAILIHLKGFEFSFRGDDRFTPERVHFMETMVNQQINALLSKEILYTKDVFVPDRIPETIPSNKETEEYTKEEKFAQSLWENYSLSARFSTYLMECEADPEMILYFRNNPREEVHLNLQNGRISLFADEEKIDAFRAATEYEDLREAVSVLEKAYINAMEKEKNGDAFEKLFGQAPQETGLDVERDLER